jgi:glutamine transport system permease protein
VSETLAIEPTLPLGRPQPRQSRFLRRTLVSLGWWAVSLVLLAVIVVALIALARVTSGKTVVPYQFDWKVVGDRWGLLLSGLQWTLGISAASMLLSLVFGLLLAVMRLSPLPPVRNVAVLYINVFRAIPLFVFIIWLYYGLSIVIGVNFDPLVAGIIVLTMQYAAWLAEIFRSGIQAVDRGQWEASYSIGMSPAQAFGSIILPQAVRIVIPSVANMFVGMLKDSSLVSIIGVFELIRQTQLAVSQTFRPFELYSAATLVYLVLTLGASRLVTALEHRYRY